MYLPMFSPQCVCVGGGRGGRGQDYPGELDNFEKLGSNCFLDFLAETSKVPPLGQSCLSNSWV